MSDTNIEWTHREGTKGVTWNPTTGCDKISPGCGLPRFDGDLSGGCYAMALAKRLKAMGSAKYQNDGDPRTSGPGFGVAVHPDTLTDPLRWRDPRTVFVNSMSDLFHARVPREFVARVWAVMAATPQHTYQILTKRPERMARMLGSEEFDANVRHALDTASIAEATPREERTVEIAGYPGYFVSNLGNVYTTSGRTDCAWCGVPLVGQTRKMFCSATHRSKAHYEQQMGRWTPPAPARLPLSFDVGEQGHRRVSLYRDGQARRELVHRLVLTAFVRPPHDDEQARHLDSNPANNALANLAWGTQADNWTERLRHGRHRSYSKLTEQDVAAIRGRGRAGESAYAIAKDYPVSDTQIHNVLTGAQWRSYEDALLPLPGVWLGTSIETDEYVRRADHLRETAAAIRFISAEPLLGPLPSLDLTGVDWLIIGGESGPGARPMALDWAYDLIEQARKSDTAVFVKQLGSRWSQRTASLLPVDERASGKGGNWDHWPEDLRIREYPRTAEVVTP